MASSRDDFIIAIRSAFLKKSTQQKFSLLTLVFISIFIIVLSSLELKAVRYLKTAINEIVYRSSFIISVPEKKIQDVSSKIKDHFNVYKDYLLVKEELEKIQAKNYENQFLVAT